MQCPFGVTNGPHRLLLGCPLSPRKRKSPDAGGTSVMCHFRKSRCQRFPRMNNSVRPAIKNAEAMEKRKVMTHLFSVDRTRLKLWCKMGILFSLAIYISQIPFPKDNASVKSLSLAVVAVLWITRLILERRFTFVRTRLWWPIIIFTVITILSLIVSINVDYSLRNIKKYTILEI